MRRWLALILVVACAGRAAAWDSRCYLAGGAQCKEGPATARSRWIGPSDEHRALLELGRIFGGLPSSTKNAFTLPVFTSDTQINVAFSGGTPPPPFQSAPPPNAIPVTSLQPVNFIATKRTQTRTMSFPEFAQLPDHAFSLWDWALGNETCPLGDGPDSPGAVACHEFKTHMGSVNSNHFVPQSASFYAYYHQLALDRAADCKKMITKLADARPRFAEFPIACEQEALVIEAIGQHFLQDAWASGHMWERWGSPDAADFPSPTRALLVAMTSGLIHGARAVLEDLPTEAVALLGTTEYHFDDPLNAPAPAVGFRGPGDLAPQSGVGDLYLNNLIAQDGASFPAAYNRLFSCEAAGLRAVYKAAGEPEGPLGQLRAGLTSVDPTSDTSCFGQRDTNAAMQKGIGLDFSTPDGTPVRIELDSFTATLLVPILSTKAGGSPTPFDIARYQVDMASVVAIAHIRALQDPNGVTLASGGLPPLLGIKANRFYVKSPLAAYVDPPLPWPGGTGAAADRAAALARTFHRAHAIDWCNAFNDNDPQKLDVAALKARVETLRADQSASEAERVAACAVCREFAARHLRVGTGVLNYDHGREPLCKFLADNNAAAAQFVYEPGESGDTIAALAEQYCGCQAVTVTVDPATPTVAPGGSQQLTATVHGTSDHRVTWSIIAGAGTVDQTGLFTAAGTTGTATVRATSVADTSAFGEATITIATPKALANLSIVSGHEPGLLEAFVSPVGGPGSTFSSPIGDVAGFTSQVHVALAGVTEIGLLDIRLNAPDAVALDLAIGTPVGDLNVNGSGCSSSVTVSVGNVRPNANVNASTRGLVLVGGCLSHVTLTVGDVASQVLVSGANGSHVSLTANHITGAPGSALFLGCLSFQCQPIVSSTIDVQASAIAFLSIANSSNSTMSVHGTIQRFDGIQTGVDIRSNTNLTLGAPLVYGDVGSVTLNDNTFAAAPTLTIGNEVAPRDPNTTNLGLVSIQRNSGLSLGKITMGDVAGDLTIASNHGFSNTDAQDFVNARTVDGAVTVFGNAP